MNERSPTVELLIDIGVALHGDEFVYKLADDIEVDQRTIRGWISGKRILHANNTAMQRAFEVLEAHTRQCLKVRDQVRAFATAQPRKPAPTRRIPARV